MTGVRHLITLAALTAEEQMSIVERAAAFARTGGRVARQPLTGASVGVYFRRTSTRTRTAFTVAAHRLGAQVIAYGPNDLQLNTGETVEDTGRVLAGMLDGLVARTADDPAELDALARGGAMSVINAMTADEHPTQAITDLSTLLALRGSLEKVRIGYLGEGNNTAAALALAVARLPGAALRLCTPPGYGLAPRLLAEAQRCADRHGAIVTETQRPELDDEVDAIYTARWETTGTSKDDPGWRQVFAPFRVTERTLERHPEALFLHDLPAHRGEEVDAEVLDGPRSVAFTQARHKVFGAMAVLEWTMAAGPA